MTQQQELIPMEPGEFLKQKRIERKISLDVVAKAINLDESLLRKIEQGNASHIAPVYRNGYIQSYASFLEIPEDEIRKLIGKMADEEASLRTVFSEPPKRSPVDNWLRASSYVLASLLIGTLAWQFTHEAARRSGRIAVCRYYFTAGTAAEKPGECFDYVSRWATRWFGEQHRNSRTSVDGCRKSAVTARRESLAGQCVCGQLDRNQ